MACHPNGKTICERTAESRRNSRPHMLLLHRNYSSVGPKHRAQKPVHKDSLYFESPTPPGIVCVPRQYVTSLALHSN
ncbi:hypothetical protein NPIL_107061 [Nephila pilipes]|uniref:Uncharacterized protein n=1 Tax=Nephila pilipes TaxID=299642 RepID=A0A8X6T9T7_NEPPI|nr:hypothetical protein NPIL_107061 [Nephila pilipes]